MVSNDEQESEQIRVSLILSKACSDSSLKVPSDPIAVPSTTRKKGLSAIVNHLLDRDVTSEDLSSDSDEHSDDDEKMPSVPFDFLVNNKLLRLTIGGAVRREGLSLEKAVEIHYFPARSVPQNEGESEKLPNWITSMSYTNQMLYSGSCDGSIRVFHNNETNQKVGFTQAEVIKAHSGAVNCLASFGCLDGSNIIASGSIDQTLVTHNHCIQKNGRDSVALHAVYSGGHTSSINSVKLAFPNNNLTLASGDWDGGLCIWRVPQDSEFDSSYENTDVHSRKKRKGSSSKNSLIEVKEVSPTLFIKAHKSCISGIAWGHEHFNHGHSTLFTSSWDHSIKAWDVESQNEILALNGSKVVTSLGRCCNSNVVATGHPDCSVRLWDTRMINGGDGNIFDGTLRPSHKSWISSVEWSPKDAFVLASSSHDGSVKIWDIRSSIPLHTVLAHDKGHKSFCLSFTNESIFSGGSDCIVKKFKF